MYFFINVLDINLAMSLVLKRDENKQYFEISDTM